MYDMFTTCMTCNTETMQPSAKTFSLAHVYFYTTYMSLLLLMCTNQTDVL